MKFSEEKVKAVEILREAGIDNVRSLIAFTCEF
jgi:hypothetical protein